ncbi:MAG: hypothetical protein AAGD14_17590 [Planctomycetota bacterium]
MSKRIGTKTGWLLVAALSLGITGYVAHAAHDDDLAENGGEDIDLEEARVFIVWNATDTDLGMHLFWDGEPWKGMRVDNPAGDEVLEVEARANLKVQGMKEGSFESAEPKAAELTMQEFFLRHPEGVYEFEGRTQKGDELDGEAEFTHVLPAPPRNLSPAAGDVVSRNGFTARFDLVAKDTRGKAIQVAYYEVFLEKEDDDAFPRSFSVTLPPTRNAVAIPAAFLEPNTRYTVDVVVHAQSGNRTIVESGVFKTDGE